MRWLTSRTTGLVRNFAARRRRSRPGRLRNFGEFIIETFGGGQQRPRR